MANVKISELTSVTTPLAGTETLPVVQSSTTKKATVADVLNSVNATFTANGVAYANGSKVLTTGSALTFDGANLGVGTASPGAKFAVYSSNPTRGITEILRNDASATQTGIQVQLSQNAIADWAFGQPAATNAFAFWYGRNTGADGTECARFTSSGYFKASNTGTYLNSTGTYSEFYQTADDVSLLVTAAASSLTQGCNGVQIYYPNATPNSTTATYLYCSDASAQRAAIRSNGGIANFQANDLNLSDRREKHDFAPAKRYLDVVCAIPVQTFKYIDQTDDEPTLGVVAQDVQAVAPELVSESNWGTADEPKLRLSVYQTDLQYALMKAIQDLAADNQQLRARVEALEAAQTAVR